MVWATYSLVFGLCTKDLDHESRREQFRGRTDDINTRILETVVDGIW